MSLLGETRLLTVGEVALHLRQSERTVRDKIDAGDLLALKLGSGPRAPSSRLGFTELRVRRPAWMSSQTLQQRAGLYQGKCQACYRADNQRRAAKQRAAGRTSARWRRLKQQAKEAAGYRCQVCGVAEAPTPAGWLDVHLRDRSRSHSDSSLTVADLIVTCPTTAPTTARRPRGAGVAS